MTTGVNSDAKADLVADLTRRTHNRLIAILNEKIKTDLRPITISSVSGQDNVALEIADGRTQRFEVIPFGIQYRGDVSRFSVEGAFVGRIREIAESHNLPIHFSALMRNKSPHGEIFAVYDASVFEEFLIDTYEEASLGALTEFMAAFEQSELLVKLDGR